MSATAECLWAKERCPRWLAVHGSPVRRIHVQPDDFAGLLREVRRDRSDTLNCRTSCGASRWRSDEDLVHGRRREVPTVFAKARTVPCVSPSGSCHPEKPLLAAGQPSACLKWDRLDWMPIDTEVMIRARSRACFCERCCCRRPRSPRAARAARPQPRSPLPSASSRLSSAPRCSRAVLARIFMQDSSEIDRPLVAPKDRSRST